MLDNNLDKNNVNLRGTLLEKPEIKQKEGQDYIKVTLLTENRRMIGQEWKELNETHEVVIINSIAISNAINFTKDTKVEIEGYLTYKKFKDSQGKIRQTCYVMAEDIRHVALDNPKIAKIPFTQRVSYKGKKLRRGRKAGVSDFVVGN